MSRLAALAMRDLADCLRDEGDALPAGMAKATLFALARAHEAAADRIEARANGKLKVPAEYESGQAGTRRRER